jgi:hypothetical protein
VFIKFQVGPQVLWEDGGGCDPQTSEYSESDWRNRWVSWYLGRGLWLKNRSRIEWSQRTSPWERKLEVNIEEKVSASLGQRARKGEPRQREQQRRNKLGTGSILAWPKRFCWKYNKVLDHKRLYMLFHNVWILFQCYFWEAFERFWASKWHNQICSLETFTKRVFSVISQSGSF